MKTTRLSDTSTAKPKSAERSHCNNGRRVALLPFLKCLGQSKNSRRASQVFALGAGVDGAVGVGVHIGRRCCKAATPPFLQAKRPVRIPAVFHISDLLVDDMGLPRHAPHPSREAPRKI